MEHFGTERTLEAFPASHLASMKTHMFSQVVFPRVDLPALVADMSCYTLVIRKGSLLCLHCSPGGG